LLFSVSGEDLAAEARGRRRRDDDRHARDIDRLTLGQKVDIRFCAFDQRSTPERKGGVVSMSPDEVTEQCSGVD
jgi:hypothetical protein